MMEISGAIGLTHLKKNNREYYIFYDQHNNSEYCKDPYYIDKFMDHIKDDQNSLILLEELLDYGDGHDIITLWTETEHTVRFKDFFNKNSSNQRVKPFDIRTLLLPISIQLLISYLEDNEDTENLFELDDDLKNLTVRSYFYPLLYFFNLVDKDDYLHTYYDKLIKHIKIVKKEIINCFKKIGKDNSKLSKKIFIHYLLIKKKSY